MERADVAIVGAGQSGGEAALLLRRLGFGGSIALIGEEEDAPYERPPLSKEYLAGSMDFGRMLVAPDAPWDRLGIRLILRRRCVSVSGPRKELVLNDGTRIAYGALVWAAGGRPQSLACVPQGFLGIHAIRSRRDIDQIRAELSRARRIAVIGGGFIGLEAAAVLSALGKEVVIIEAMERTLSRLAGPAVSAVFEAEHRRHGVEILTGAFVDKIETGAGRVSAVRLDSGERVAADLIIVAVGTAPAMEPLAAAGARCGDGIEIDRCCRTSLPDVFAIGDCTLQQHPLAPGSWVRLETVQNAKEQALRVACMLAGSEPPPQSVPWFWSDQYDLRLQSAGLKLGCDEVTIRGDPEARSFSVFYLRKGKVLSVDAVNATRDYVHGRALIQSGRLVPSQSLADPKLQIKDMLRPEPAAIMHGSDGGPPVRNGGAGR